MAKQSPTEHAFQAIKLGKSIEDLADSATRPSVGVYLNDYIIKRGLSIEVTANLAGLNKTSLYRIIKGNTNASRNVLLRLSRALHMSYEETQTLLKYGNTATLSGSNARDIYIMNAIYHDKDIYEIDQILIGHHLPEISSNG